MSRTDHHGRTPRTPRFRREGGLRTATRNSLAAGLYDDQPTTMPTRLLRRP